MRRVTFLLAAAAAAAAVTVSAFAAPPHHGPFKPHYNLGGYVFYAGSRQIPCVVQTPLDPLPYWYVRCDSPLHGGNPAAVRAERTSCAAHQLGYGSLVVKPAGKGTLACTGDAIDEPDMPMLRPGQSFRLNAFACAGIGGGVRCTNRTGHGFLVTLSTWKTF